MDMEVVISLSPGSAIEARDDITLAALLYKVRSSHRAVESLAAQSNFSVPSSIVG